jgi:hypothetical protein
MAQLADREAQMEHGLIATYDEYELDFHPVPKPEATPARRTPPPHRTPTSRGRSRAWNRFGVATRAVPGHYKAGDFE